MSIQAVADDLRTNEDDQLGAGSLLVLMGEDIAQPLYFVEQGNSVAVSDLLLADQAGEQHRLPGGDGDRASHPPFRNRRRQAAGRLWPNVADFLLHLQPDGAVGTDSRRYVQDDAGVAIIDGVDDGVACREHGGASGRYRHDVADLQGRDPIVDDDQRGVRQHLDTGDGVKRIEDGGWLHLRSDEEVESRKGAVDEGAGRRRRDTSNRTCGRGRRFCGLRIEQRALIWLQPQILARNVELHAVAQLVGQSDFGDGRIDRYLKLWLVDLPQRGLDDLVVALIRIDQEGIVDDIGRDAYPLHQRLTAAACARASASACADAASVELAAARRGAGAR